MITVDFLSKGGENEYYYYYVVNSVITVDCIVTDFPAVALKRINKLKSQSLIYLYEQFQNTVNEIKTDFPKIQTYDEALVRISKFIPWGCNNLGKEDEIIKYAIEMTSKLTLIVNEIPNSVPEKKTLIFLIHCVTLTANKRITI